MAQRRRFGLLGWVRERRELPGAIITPGSEAFINVD
jgi:hypothetical protein